MRNRLRLWLRSERALGLDDVRAPAGFVRQAPVAAPVQAAAPVPRRSAPAPREALPPVAPARREVRPVRQSVAVPRQAPPPALPSVEPFTAPVLSSEQKRLALAQLDRDQVSGCTRCSLHELRTHTVFGEGDVDATLCFVGEAPGENEDLAGRPFVGRAGQKLEDMIKAMGLERAQVYIANVVKCRPPGNRAPIPAEIAACAPYLERQLEIVRPRIIVALGLSAAQYLLRTKKSMGAMRGHWHVWRGIKVMPTYHPAYLLRNYTDETRAAVWSDLRMVMKEMGLPARGGAAGSA